MPNTQTKIEDQIKVEFLDALARVENVMTQAEDMHLKLVSIHRVIQTAIGLMLPETKDKLWSFNPNTKILTIWDHKIEDDFYEASISPG
jgi:hypothetical protein